MPWYDTFLARLVLRNGALLTLLPLLISLGLWGFLPAAYLPEVFWRDIPNWLSFPENVLRIAVFAVPGLLVFQAADAVSKWGWALYAAGVLLYLASYVLQIVAPGSALALSWVGFAAPAWTTAVWLAGIAFACPKSWLPLPWSRWVYGPVAVVFLAFHVTHTTLVWSRL